MPLVTDGGLDTLSDMENGSGLESPVIESSRALCTRIRIRNRRQRTQGRQDQSLSNDEDDGNTRSATATPAKCGRSRTSSIWNHCTGRGINIDCN